MPCDLADPAARGRLVAEVEARGQRVDILVNSAGLGTYGAFAPSMAAERSGAVLIVSSGIGFGPAPRYTTYSATKAFCIAFGGSLHAELRRSGVAVSTLCPGPVATEFFAPTGPSQCSG